RGVAIGVKYCGFRSEDGVKPAKIPRAARGRRQCRQERVAGALARSLIVEKEEGPVLDDRSAGTEAELVQLEWRDGIGGRVEVVFGIEGAVPQELIHRAV